MDIHLNEIAQIYSSKILVLKKISDASINKVPTDKTGLQNIRIFGMVTYVGLFILRL